MSVASMDRDGTWYCTRCGKAGFKSKAAVVGHQRWCEGLNSIKNSYGRLGFWGRPTSESYARPPAPPAAAPAPPGPAHNPASTAPPAPPAPPADIEEVARSIDPSALRSFLSPSKETVQWLEQQRIEQERIEQERIYEEQLRQWYRQQDAIREQRLQHMEKALFNHVDHLAQAQQQQQQQQQSSWFDDWGKLLLVGLGGVFVGMLLSGGEDSGPERRRNPSKLKGKVAEVAATTAARRTITKLIK